MTPLANRFQITGRTEQMPVHVIDHLFPFDTVQMIHLDVDLAPLRLALLDSAFLASVTVSLQGCLSFA